MDKAILKKFAIESRQDLMQRMEKKIKTFYIDEEFSKQQSGDVYILANAKHSLNLSKEEYDKRELLIKRINELGLDQVIEEAAYTWFNRIVAIRYMEIHDYLPLTRDNQSLGVRVLSSKDNTPDPEIMKFTNLVNPDLDIDFKKEKYVELKDNNEKFKYILLLVCRKLGRVIPQVFDGVTDYIDILVPDNLLNESGFINKIVTEVPVENYEQVEIIGWLYQYYNQTEKDRVISAKKAYKKNEIPYATQLFTPDWIVKYMVENSLGKFWIEHGGNIEITKKWKYYVNDGIIEIKENINPKEIKCIDPCMGSGHILIYMFEVLYQIYESYGYSKKDISEQILKNNLYGLDIDDRAGQLSILSVLLKARSYDKEIFNKTTIKNINIMSIQETSNITKDTIEFLKSSTGDKEISELFEYVCNKFKNSKEIGSLLILEKKDYEKSEGVIQQLNNSELNIFDIDKMKTINEKIVPAIKNANILTKKYEIIVTNPPYLNASLMNQVLGNYIKENYLDFKSDLFSAFICKINNMTQKNGYNGLVTPYVWMFLKTYESLRKYILFNVSIQSLIQLEYNSFESACVPVCTFILKNTIDEKIMGTFIKLSDFPGAEMQSIRTLDAIHSDDCSYKYITNQNILKNIEGMPISYWITKDMYNIIQNPKLSSIGVAKSGMQTGNNDLFLRLWYEVDINKIGFNYQSNEECKNNNKKWIPQPKGGAFRKWYGNFEYVVNYENNGENISNYEGTGILKNQDYYFKEGITWSHTTTRGFAARYLPKGYIFNVEAPTFYTAKDDYYYLLGWLNTKIVNEIFKYINQTMHFLAGDMEKIPLSNPLSIEEKQKVVNLVKENIILEKEDWDESETSWNFKVNPLIKISKQTGIKNIEILYKKYAYICEERFNKVKKNEEEINSIFLKNNFLNEEISKEIDEEDITIRKTNSRDEIINFLSYFIGCIFGRYSLDYEGLNVSKSFQNLQFKADQDNVIPLTEYNYFTNDIICRLKEFLIVLFGKEYLNENMEYIAEQVSRKHNESSESIIRKYFIEEFFENHCNKYTSRGAGKRPIYWLLDSGKKNGFKALIYMHRYNENLIPKARLDYLHRVQTTYEKLLSDVNYKLTTELSMLDKKEAQKRQADLNAKLQEIKEYDEKIAHIANQRISIYLDDGVKVNYEKFKDILARIK